MTTLASKGLAFQQALFVPPESSYRKLGAPELHHNKDLSWQQGLQKVYQSHLTSSSNGVSILQHPGAASCYRGSIYGPKAHTFLLFQSRMNG